jgi:hypothetical protein
MEEGSAHSIPEFKAVHTDHLFAVDVPYQSLIKVWLQEKLQGS